MTGYQEIVTDPSFAEQIVCFTAPMVGNYGVEPHRAESGRAQARAVLMREARGPAWTDWLHEHGIVALSGIDTRSLVLHLRERGAMRAIAVDGDVPVDEAVAACKSSRRWPGGRSRRASRRPSPTSRARGPRAGRGRRLRLQALDPAPPRREGAAVTSSRTTPSRQLAGYDGVLLSNGPGDPEPLDQELVTVCGLLGRTPVLGDLPRPPAPGAGRPAARRSSCRSATAARTTRCSTAAPTACS